jgi:hypothetical protein
MSRVRAKICGVRTPEDAMAAARAGASMVGLVFVPGSPREIDRGQAEVAQERDEGGGRKPGGIGAARIPEARADRTRAQPGRTASTSAANRARMRSTNPTRFA